MYTKLLTLLAISLLAACSHFDHHHGHTDSSHASHTSHSSDNKPLKLELDGNNKWLMDAHTRTITSEMSKRFASIDLEQQDQETLSQLGEQLNQDLDKLIQGCTMEGEAHNALHDFLTSFIPALEALKAQANISSAKHVEHLLIEYQNYFE